MKVLAIITVILITIPACGNGSGSSSEAFQPGTYLFSNFEALASDPCQLINEELVLEFIDVDRSVLEKNSFLMGGGSSISEYSYCTYEWNKPDFEEIIRANQQRISEAISDPEISVAEAGMQWISPVYMVGVAKLRLYDDEEQAVSRFTMSHQVPTEEAMEQFRAELDRSMDEEELSDDSREAAGDLTEGIASRIQFTPVDGIGDLAVWDHLDRRLVVLAGRYQFGISLEVYEDLEANIELARTIALRVMEQF